MSLPEASLRRRQRLSAYGVLTRSTAGLGAAVSAQPAGTELLLTRISARGHHPGAWTLPGGGVEHGEDPRSALVRELAEETGLAIRPGRLLDVHSSHFVGRAPDGVTEDFHGVHLLFAVTVDPDQPAGAATGAGQPGQAAPAVAEADGTTDAVAWIDLARLRAGDLPVLAVVRFVLELLDRLGTSQSANAS